MAWVQHVDPPGNVFPSLHVAHTSMLAFLLLRDRPRLGLVALVMATLLALSTLTTKQHFIADVLGGYTLAFLGRAFALSSIGAKQLDQVELFAGAAVGAGPGTLARRRLLGAARAPAARAAARAPLIGALKLIRSN